MADVMMLVYETAQISHQRSSNHPLLDLFEVDIVARRLFVGTGCGGWAVLPRLVVLVHAFLHFTEPFAYLPGGAVDGQRQPENELVQQICQKNVKNELPHSFSKVQSRKQGILIWKIINVYLTFAPANE